MQMSRCVVGSAFVSRAKPLVIAVSAAMLMCSTAYAASFGHSRIVSSSGQPLRIEVLVSQLSADDQRSLVVVPAPETAWKQAALKPPVDLSTLHVHLKDGVTPNSKVVQITSVQPFEQPVADLLLNVLTASGQQQYQVSILAYTSAGAPVAAKGVASGDSLGAVQAQGGQRAGSAGSATGSIRVRRGDTMFAIAQRNAVSGVSVYQMMIALQRANPQAFINENINLVKAGATLSMPGQDALTAISDHEARRLFLQQAQAFDAYRQGRGAKSSTSLKADSAAQGQISAASSAHSPQTPAAPRDQVVLSSGSASNDASSDDRLATSKGIADSQQRVSQLEQNVKSLNQALQSQGEAAKNVFVEGAKGLGQSIADVAGSVAAGNSASAGEASSSSSSSSSSGAGSAAAPAGSAQAGVAATAESRQGASSSGASVRGGAGASASSSPIDPSSPAAESYAGQVKKSGEQGAGSATNSGAATGAGAPGQGDGASKQAAPDQAGKVAEQISNKAETSVSWFQEHLLGVITGLLAFIVLVIAWLLRRANSPRDDDHGQVAPITEAMVQEQLDKINLDLRQPPADEPSSAKK
jgi:pilus assembly protein FimV